MSMTVCGLVWCRFNREYTQLKNRGVEPRVDVRFTLNRFPILNMHRALTLIKKHNALNIVMPEPNTYLPPTSTNVKSVDYYLVAY